MRHNQSNYDLLIKKLDEFIRKYYINQLIRGIILALALMLTYFILINLLEYFFYLPGGWRKFLFWSFLTLGSGVTLFWIILPILHYLKLGRLISHEQAAQIIGRHFPEVEDKLLNVLQLKKLADKSNSELIEASINQKIELLRPVPFKNAVNLKENKKRLPYLLPPLLILLVILLTSPNLFKESTTRIINSNKVFVKKAPFEFIVLNEELKAVQFEDFEVKIKVEGSVLPEQVYIERNGTRIKTDKLTASTFSYRFNNLQEDVKFRFEASGYKSGEYTIKVIPSPVIIGFDVALDYPAYTGLKDENLHNLGDLVIPQGTVVHWRFFTENTGTVNIQFTDTSFRTVQTGENNFEFTRAFLKNEWYAIQASNEYILNGDSIAYNITVIPDNYPSIKVEEFQDTISPEYLFYLGEAADDYGIRNLYFKYKIIDEGQNNRTKWVTKPVNFNRNTKNTKFNYYWNTKELNLNPGARVEYYFEVWDNDGVNGSKYSRTPVMYFNKPTVEEFEKINEQSKKKIKSSMEELIEEARDIKEEVEMIQEDILQKKNLNWEDKKKIEELLEKQKSLRKQIEEMQNDYSKTIEQQSEYKTVTERIREKQEKLQELFEELFSEEMKELFKKMEELLDELSREELMKNLDEMEINEEKIEKELDRMLELFKRLELEQKVTETIDELRELAKEQEELSEKTGENSSELSDIEEKQKELNEKVEKLREKLKEADQLDQELGDMMDFDETDQKMDEAEQEMQNSLQEIQENKRKKASQKQKSAAEKLNEAAEKLAQMMSSMEMEQLQLDMYALRQLLENLVYLSFEQEELIEQVKSTNINNPEFLDIVKRQYEIERNFRVVEDSLYALSKRVFQLETFITNEVVKIKKELSKSKDFLEERLTRKALTSQQLTMTSFNNLALMLNEALEQMQQEMANQMPGMQMCQKNSGQKMGLQKLSQMQKQLNDKISQLQQEIKEGKRNGPTSKELAKMAAEQAAIREALRKLNQEIVKEGDKGNSAQYQKMMEEMEKTEEDLVNKQLTTEMLKRQQEILTRLLEAEKAERERKKDEERESKTAEQIAKEIPPSLEEYLKKKNSEIELYKTLPPNLQPYYKTLVEKYFKTITF